MDVDHAAGKNALGRETVVRQMAAGRMRERENSEKNITGRNFIFWILFYISRDKGIWLL